MGIVNAVDICKYPQHFNRLLLIAMNKYVLFLIFIFSCIGCGETNEQDANTIEGNTDTSQITIAPVIAKDIEEKLKANMNITKKRDYIDKKREVYVFKEGETVYFNSPLVNNCLFQQKIDKQNYNCSQKNCYFNIVIYNKSLKNGLSGNITRLEFSFKNVFNTPKIKYINNHMEFLEIINKLSSKIETYLFKTFDIAIQKNEDKSYLSFGKGAVNNTNYLKELKVI
mgnify:CR=1 FL=1